ncbi:MAG: 4Fe-4S binding protein [Bacillota bacterium]
MGLKFDSGKCNGCGKCVDICPGDLLFINQSGKSAIRNQAECWDCMACVKTCPAGALETRLPFCLADYGASLKPEVGTEEIRWVCKHPDGEIEVFTIPRG